MGGLTWNTKDKTMAWRRGGNKRIYKSGNVEDKRLCRRGGEELFFDVAQEDGGRRCIDASEWTEG